MQMASKLKRIRCLEMSKCPMHLNVELIEYIIMFSRTSTCILKLPPKHRIQFNVCNSNIGNQLNLVYLEF